MGLVPLGLNTLRYRQSSDMEIAPLMISYKGPCRLSGIIEAKPNAASKAEKILAGLICMHESLKLLAWRPL